MDFATECDRLRDLLRLRGSRPASGDKDAGVLILLDGSPAEYRVFLCVRSENLRRHPGEVCFPGGMKDEADADLQQTAMREAEEEVGLLPDDYEILGSLPSFRSRFGVVIHPAVALLRRPFDLRLNPEEVTRCFWKPLKEFLDDREHTSLVLDARYSVHSFYMPIRSMCGLRPLFFPLAVCALLFTMFKFPEAHTYGVTALMSIAVAMAVLQRHPMFDLTPQVTLPVMEHITVDDAIDTVFFAASMPFKPKSMI